MLSSDCDRNCAYFKKHVRFSLFSLTLFGTQISGIGAQDIQLLWDIWVSSLFVLDLIAVFISEFRTSQGQTGVYSYLMKV